MFVRVTDDKKAPADQGGRALPGGTCRALFRAKARNSSPDTYTSANRRRKRPAIKRAQVSQRHANPAKADLVTAKAAHYLNFDV